MGVRSSQFMIAVATEALSSKLSISYSLRGYIFFTSINSSHTFQSLTVFPEVISFHPIARTLPGFKLSLCSTKGTPPVYTALTRNSTVLINTTRIYITIRLHEEGNYSCVATGKYGADVKDFSVIFNGEAFFDRKHL